MKKVVILGAGLGSRLYPITNEIPKVLVNYKQHTVLKHLYDLYSNQSDEIILVIHSKFNDLVKGYIKSINMITSDKPKFTIRNVDVANGSAHAIDCIAEDIIGHNVLFNWCDIIPEGHKVEWDNDYCYTYGTDCRFTFEEPYLREIGTGGGVVGLYQVANWTGFDRSNYGEDLADNLDSMVHLTERKLDFVVDVGDKLKLAKAHEDSEINREFNKLEFTENLAIKVPTNELGKEIQSKEINWYNSIDSEFVPSIVDFAPGEFIKMERIFGRTMADAYRFMSKETKVLMVYKVISALRSFGGTIDNPSDEQWYSDVKKEVLDKVLIRNASIAGLIEGFAPQGITHVNDFKVGDPEKLLRHALEILSEHKEPYQLIHGDPHYSNIMLSDEGDIKIIDPRGYFGNSSKGPAIYDEAKVLYSIDGYDKFNSDPLWGGLTRNGTRVFVDIEKVMPLDDIPMCTFKHKLWIAVIWMALAGYFKNNPLKALGAYYNGLYQLSVLLKRHPRKRKLITGEFVDEVRDPITAQIITRCPDKWVLLDQETGVKYKPTGSTELHKQWKKI
ncbi:hypothetical protein KIT01_044 [Escherichia phage KIT01]|nr:hypothetical protein KIT01_044 [Escherichia phage KIT01]